MKEKFTSINVIIDASGSMKNLVTDTIGGFNSFLEEQKKLKEEAIFSLSIFNTHNTIIHDCVPLDKVPELTAAVYKTTGGTALLDALGSSIDNVGRKLASLPEAERPSKVIFLVITDGQENSSSLYDLNERGHKVLRYNKNKLSEMVKHQRDVYKWEFVFMGANMDAISEGVSLGFSVSNSKTYNADSIGTKDLFKSVSKGLESYRTKADNHVNFFDQDKK